jgi:hypothetical protein
MTHSVVSSLNVQECRGFAIDRRIRRVRIAVECRLFRPRVRSGVRVGGCRCGY